VLEASGATISASGKTARCPGNGTAKPLPCWLRGQRRVEWAAVNHFNTDYPHAHVIIRGVDLDDRELRSSRRYISHGMRWTAQELATQELGLGSSATCGVRASGR
jgi:hypothetical protein